MVNKLEFLVCIVAILVGIGALASAAKRYERLSDAPNGQCTANYGSTGVTTGGAERGQVASEEAMNEQPQAESRLARDRRDRSEQAQREQREQTQRRAEARRWAQREAEEVKEAERRRFDEAEAHERQRQVEAKCREQHAQAQEANRRAHGAGASGPSSGRKRCSIM